MISWPFVRPGWMRKTRVDAEDIVVSGQVGVSRRSRRFSGLVSAAAVVWSPVVEKKRGRRKAGDVNEQMSVEEQPADVQALGRTRRSLSAAVAKVSVRVSAVSPVVESKRSRRKVQEEEPAVQKVGKVEISGRTTRSSSIAASVMSPPVVENKRRRKTNDVHSDGELPTVLEVPRNDASVTRSLRNRAVQVNDSVLENSHVGKKLENRRQPIRPATRRHQQLAPSVEEDAQEQAHEHDDFKNNNIHLSEVRFGEIGQSSSIIELVPNAGILTENKTLLYEGEVDLGAKGIQTLNADSSEYGLGILNESAGVAQEIRPTTAVCILEDEAPVDEGVNNNGMDCTVGIQDVSIALLEQLLGASDKLQIVDEVAPCTCDAVVMENDFHVCDGANWTDIKSTEGTENGDIALSNDGHEAFKSVAVVEEAPSCTVACVLEDDTLFKEEIGMKNNEASFSLVDTGSCGNGSDRQPTKSLEASLFKFNPNYLPTVNAETEKQSDEEVASQFLSHCDDTTITVIQKYIQGVSTDGNLSKHHQPSSDRTNSNDLSIFSGSSETDVVPVDFTAGYHEEKYPVSPVAEQNKVSGEANTNESAEKTLADIIPAVLHTKDLQHDHNHAPGKLVDILAKETGKEGSKLTVTTCNDMDGKSRCFGFINFENPDDAACAVEELNGRKINDKEWYVGRAQKKSEREMELKRRFEQSMKDAVVKYQGLNLYLKNLDDSIADDQLRELFSIFGKISSCKVMRDQNGVSKGSGFVAFSTREEASQALTEMNGKMISGKPLYIAFAQRKEERKAMLQVFVLEPTESVSAHVENQSV